MHDRSRGSTLRDTVEAHLEDGHAEVVTIERKYFSDIEGMQFLNNHDLCVLTNVTVKGLETKYLAVAAARALHQYWYAACQLLRELNFDKLVTRER